MLMELCAGNYCTSDGIVNNVMERLKIYMKTISNFYSLNTQPLIKHK